jgi:hypothetical protein
MNFIGIPLWLNEDVPRPARDAMKRLGLISFLEKWIRRLSSTHLWPLKGPLERLNHCIAIPAEKTFMTSQINP